MFFFLKSLGIRTGTLTLTVTLTITVIVITITLTLTFILGEEADPAMERQDQQA